MLSYTATGKICDLKMKVLTWLFATCALSVGVVARNALPDLYEASIVELQVTPNRRIHAALLNISAQAGLDAGDFTSVDLVKVFFF